MMSPQEWDEFWAPSSLSCHHVVMSPGQILNAPRLQSIALFDLYKIFGNNWRDKDH